MKMLSRLFNAFRAESWSSRDRYGIEPKALLVAALELSPEGSILEVPSEDFGLLPKNYPRRSDYQSLLFSDGEAFAIDADFIDCFQKDDDYTPETYCILGDNAILLTVIDHGDILDFSRKFIKLLDSRLSAEDKKAEHGGGSLDDRRY